MCAHGQQQSISNVVDSLSLFIITHISRKSMLNSHVNCRLCLNPFNKLTKSLSSSRLPWKMPKMSSIYSIYSIYSFRKILFLSGLKMKFLWKKPIYRLIRGTDRAHACSWDLLVKFIIKTEIIVLHNRGSNNLWGSGQEDFLGGLSSPRGSSMTLFMWYICIKTSHIQCE